MNAVHAPARNLRILAADETEQALQPTVALLEGLGHDVRACVASVADAVQAITREDPDASVVVVHEDVGHALDLIEELYDVSSGPIVAVLEAARPEVIRAAAERGIAAVAMGVSADELQASLDFAVARHAEAIRLSARVGQLEHALERRALIERAKGILMERHEIDERTAFERLRSHARQEQRQVVSVAREVCEALDDPSQKG